MPLSSERNHPVTDLTIRPDLPPAERSWHLLGGGAASKGTRAQEAQRVSHLSVHASDHDRETTNSPVHVCTSGDLRVTNIKANHRALVCKSTPERRSQPEETASSLRVHRVQVKDVHTQTPRESTLCPKSASLPREIFRGAYI